MKQTAVEWLIETIDEFYGYEVSARMINQIKQAKQMEKEQIIDAWDDAYDKGTRDRFEKISNPVGNAEQYYNEKFMI